MTVGAWVWRMGNFRGTWVGMGGVVLTAPSGGFPGGSVVKNIPANTGDAGSILSREDPLEKGMATHCSILAWEIPWSLAGTVHSVTKSRQD